MATLTNQFGLDPYSKMAMARCRILSYPQRWFGDSLIDERDKALLSAVPVSFVDYSKGSYLRKLYHRKIGSKDFGQTDWIVETDDECKRKIFAGGAEVFGFDYGEQRPLTYNSMTLNVNISSTPGSGFDWGFLSTSAKNVRLFKGPIETCNLHPWDAMILRDCTPNTASLEMVADVASRAWDILVMKMCEDYDHPWTVVSVRDAGPRPEPTCLEVDCCCLKHTQAAAEAEKK